MSDRKIIIFEEDVVLESVQVDSESLSIFEDNIIQQNIVFEDEVEIVHVANKDRLEFYDDDDDVITIYEPGPKGNKGDSAYDLWISQGNSGSLSDFLNSLIGPSGSSGSGSATIPAGTVSGSSQIIYSQITGVPNNLFSSSQQVIFSQITGTFSTGSFVQIASFNSFSSSAETKIQRLENVTGSFAIKTEITGAFTLISSSLSGRIGTFEGKSLISGSEQLTSSYDQRYHKLGTGIFSSSVQVDYNLIQNQPTSILSASYALTASYISGSNSVSSSYALTASFATNIQTIGIRIKTDDSFIIEGSKGYKHIGYNSNIVKLRSVANIAGNININVKRGGSLLGNYQLSNQSSSIDTALTNWTSSLNTNDLIEFYVSQSSTYITDITFFLDLQNR